VTTLLLHQHRVTEALAQLKRHVELFRRPPPGVPPGYAAWHFSWVTRQYKVVGELLGGRVNPANLPPQRDAQPAYFFFCAGQAAIDRRRASQAAREARGGIPSPIGEVLPGAYVGQLLLSAGNGAPEARMNEDEFVRHLEIEESEVSHTRISLELLTTALELYKHGEVPAGRLLQHLISLMAHEHLVAGDALHAQQLLESVASAYRREKWDGPLAGLLVQVRECAVRLDRIQDQVQYGLELSCLHQTLLLPQREAAANSALQILHQAMSSDSEHLELDIQPGSASMLSCLGLQAGFLASPHQPPPNTKTHPAVFRIAVWSNLPVDIPYQHLQVEVEGSSGTHRLTLVPITGLPAAAPADMSLEGRAAAQAGDASVAASLDRLQSYHAQQLGGSPGEADNNSTAAAGSIGQQRWQALEARWQPEAAGKLQANRVILTFSGGATIAWHLTAFPEGWTTVGAVSEPMEARRGCRVGRVPVSLGPLELEVAPSHQQPCLQMSVAEVGLLGEYIQATCCVTAVDAIQGAVLSLQAAYLEGTGDPRLTSTPPSSDAALKETGLSGEASGSIDDPNVDVNLEPGRQHVFCAWVHADRAGTLRICSRLEYQAASLPGDASCKLEATTQLPVVRPFSLHQHYLSPPRQQCLLAPLPTATSPTPGPASTSASSPTPSAASGPGASSNAPTSQADGSGATALPADTPCLMALDLTNTASCPVRLQGWQLEGSGVLETQLLAGHDGFTNQDPLASEDVHSGTIQLRHSGAEEEVGLGALDVLWSRARPPQQQIAAAGSIAQQEGLTLPDPTSLWDSTRQQVASRIPLASVSFRQPVLRANMALPATMTAGVAFLYAVSLKNATPLPQRIGIAMSADTRSFLVAGSKISSSTVLPWQEQTLSWHLTPFASGSLPLPELQLTADRYKASLNVLAAAALTTMAEQSPNQPGRDQASAAVPVDSPSPASSAGPDRLDRSPQAPHSGRGGGRVQKPARGRSQRTPPPGRDHRRAFQGPEGRPKNHLQPGRRAGSVVNLKESFGFVKVHGVPDNLFFHVSEVVAEELQDVQSRLDLQKTLFPGDHVEFDIVRSDRDPGAFVAKQVKKVDPPSTAPAAPAVANGHASAATAEAPSSAAAGAPPGALEWRMARPAGQAPSPIQPASLARELGIVASIKNNFGFIRCTEREGRLFFRLGVHEKVQQEQFHIGLELSFRVILDETTRKHVAIEIELVAPGTVAGAMHHTEAVEGVVMQPPGQRPQEEGDGVISYTGADQRPCSVQYDSFVVAGEDTPGVNDRVKFNLACHEPTGTAYATCVSVLEKVAPKSEYGKVSVLKNNFGFIKPCERAADLMFHAEGLEGLSLRDLSEGDEVEFEVAHKPHQPSNKPHQPSKLCAVRVRKAPPGSAVFEEVEEEVLRGVVVERLALGKGGLTLNAGILEHGAPGCTNRLIFTAEDLQEAGVNPLAGSHVTFQQAVRPQMAASAARGGGLLASHAGRHATKVRATPMAGLVANVKGHFGFIDFREGEETRHIFFHASAVEGEVTLRVGDEVTFIVLDGGKNKELVACKIVRTKEAPPAPEKEVAKPPKELIAETNPNRMVFTGTAKPGAGKGNQVVRLARGPDGTRGFAPGRGKLMPNSSLPPASPGTPTPPILLRRSPAPGADGAKANRKAGSGKDTPKGPAPATTKGLVKTASGKLRASAAEFIPRISSDTSLSQHPSGSLPDPASVGASSAPHFSFPAEPSATTAALEGPDAAQADQSDAASSSGQAQDTALNPSHLIDVDQEMKMSGTGDDCAADDGLVSADYPINSLPSDLHIQPAHDSSAAAAAAAPRERIFGFAEQVHSQDLPSPHNVSSASHKAAAAAAATPSDPMREPDEHVPSHLQPALHSDPPSHLQPAQPQLVSNHAAVPSDSEPGTLNVDRPEAECPEQGHSPLCQGHKPGPSSNTPTSDSISHPCGDSDLTGSSGGQDGRSVGQLGLNAADVTGHAMIDPAACAVAAAEGTPIKAAEVNADGLPAQPSSATLIKAASQTHAA
ncbi:hypothetical protein WJX74_003805, partial [Apatococcus lobatus]